jgi:hypothetical protein
MDNDIPVFDSPEKAARGWHALRHLNPPAQPLRTALSGQPRAVRSSGAIAAGQRPDDTRQK